jgi:ABC-type multidrug transport system ATPase subunit
MLIADSIRLAFGAREILNDVALRLPEPGVTGLLGLNGCGKTSLLHILYGDLQPQYGYIAVDGERILRPCRMPGLVNMCGQQTRLPGLFSADRLLRLYGIDRGAFWVEHGERRQELEGRIRNGNWTKARLFHALLLVAAPTRFTFLDEPFAGLDPLGVDYLQVAILRAGRRKGVLVTDHDYRAVRAVTDRIYLLGGGSVEPL